MIPAYAYVLSFTCVAHFYYITVCNNLRYSYHTFRSRNCTLQIIVVESIILIAAMGIKTIETRGWQTTHPGHLLIHASKGKAGSIFADRPFIKKHIPDFKSLPFGAIIGMVSLTEIVQTEGLWQSMETINSLTLE